MRAPTPMPIPRKKPSRILEMTSIMVAAWDWPFSISAASGSRLPRKPSSSEASMGNFDCPPRYRRTPNRS